jgi:glycerol-3-phosphate dehydrogenase subunit B
MLAAFMALEAGARVRLIAQGIGSILVTPGWVSIADTAPGTVIDGAAAIAAESPDHPYALAGIDALQAGIAALRRLGEAVGLPYTGNLDANLRLVTALGLPQRPALAPVAMACGDGLGGDALYVGFMGWRDFYPALAGARTTVVQLPESDRPWDATPTDIARRFDDPAVRRAVAAGIKHRLGDAKAVAFPAVLGLEDPIEAHADLQDRLGLPVFEIPTLPPSVPGTRLFNRFRRYVLDKGARLQIGHPVVRGLIENGEVIGVEVAAAGRPQRFLAGRVIMATGGLYGGGLFSDDRGRIWEPIFGLPVQASPARESWFAPQMLAAEGHPVHRFGIRVNAQMQPLDTAGGPIARNLTAIGHLLAQPGLTPTAAYAEGISLATAARAVQGSLTPAANDSPTAD